MTPRSRIAVTALTHGLALAVGWWVFAGVKESRAAKEAGNGGKAMGATKLSERGETGTVAGTKSAEEILAGVLKSAEEDPFSIHVAGPRRETVIPELQKEWKDAIDALVIPDDFPAALDEVMTHFKEGSGYGPEFAQAFALMFHWAGKDPKALFDWAGSDPKRQQLLGSAIMSLTPELYRRGGIDSVLPMIGKAGRLDYQVTSDLSRSIAVNGDGAGVLKAKGALAPNLWRFLGQNIGRNWPPSKEAELVAFAVANDCPILLTGYKEQQPGQGAFLAQFLEDENLPQGFRDFLKGYGATRNAFANDRTLPLEMRLKHGGNIEQIVNGDLDHVLSAERDWAFALRHGEATVQEIWDAVAEGSPDLVREHPDKVRERLFRELAEEDPKAAMTLLADLPEEQREGMALLGARTHFNDVEPAIFLQMMEQVPSDTPEQWEGRLDAWNRRSFTNHERLEDGYVEWVRSLPEGLDREMGLYSLARAVQAGNPTLAKQLRAQVSDPQLKTRISEHR